MKFEERLAELINEADVPDELSPQNIALMLKEKSAQSRKNAEHRNIKSAQNVSAQRRTIVMRTAIATAACAVFAVGMWAYNDNRANQEQLEAPISYEATSPDSYDALFKIYTGITLNEDDASNLDSDKTIDETSVSDTESTGQPITTDPEKETAVNDSSAYGFIDYGEGNISDADAVKSDENYIYCLKGSTLYVISKETMEVVSEIESTLNSPIEMHIDGDSLILISTETEEIQVVGAVPSVGTEPIQTEQTDEASDESNNSDLTDDAASDDKASPASDSIGESAIPGADNAKRKNVVVDIYDVSDPAKLVHKTAYKQNGSYTSSKIVDGMLYTISDYSDYRVKPLDTQADLDSFVPAYYFNGDKFYLAAEDIIVPSNANSTQYTVVSAINVAAEEASATVKAVLGSSKNVYCSVDTLYIVGVGKKDREYSIISAFDLSEGGIAYRASSSVEGAVLDQYSMNEYNGMFRLATKVTDANGGATLSVYVLDKSLNVVNSAGQIYSGENASAVRFEGNYAKVIDADGKSSVMVLDLLSYPPVQSQSFMGNSAYLYGYNENRLLGIGKSDDGSLTLTMYDSGTGLAVNNVVFGKDESSEIFSAALTDRRAVLIDTENSIVGVPSYSHTEFGTKNMYRIFVYDEENGFVQKGIIGYTDLDDSMIFRRAEISGDTLYVIGEGRIISARLSDMKVIGAYEY